MSDTREKQMIEFANTHKGDPAVQAAAFNAGWDAAKADLPDRDVLARFLIKLDTGHKIHDNMQGGYGCKCGARWDWQQSEREAAFLHAERFTAEAILSLLRGETKP